MGESAVFHTGANSTKPPIGFTRQMSWPFDVFVWQVLMSGEKLVAVLLFSLLMRLKLPIVQHVHHQLPLSQSRFLFLPPWPPPSHTLAGFIRSKPVLCEMDFGRIRTTNSSGRAKLARD